MTAIGELAGLSKSRLVQMVKALEGQLGDAHEAARAVAFAEAVEACRTFAINQRAEAGARQARNYTVEDYYASGADACAAIIEKLPLRPEDE